MILHATTLALDRQSIQNQIKRGLGFFEGAKELALKWLVFIMPFMRTLQKLADLDAIVDFILQHVGPDIRLATPLGLGKPIDALNSVYRRVKANSNLQLEVYTALSLRPPRVRPNSLEARFATPFLDRHFGKDTPLLDYDEAQRSSTLPKNINVHEFYLQPGQYLRSASAQSDYISLNYTHVCQTLAQRRVNVILQMVAKRLHQGREQYSLSSNPDLTLDLIDASRSLGQRVLFIAVVHPDLPFMENDAILPDSLLDAVVEPIHSPPLFALPKPEVDTVDHMIGMHASGLVQDGGTLQIGIGSLSDAVVHALILRHQQNSIYQKMHLDWGTSAQIFCGDRFEQGLYGTSELVMDGFMHLRRAGILKRMVIDSERDTPIFLHGAFFLGSKEFYHWLCTLPANESAGICMTRVSRVNDLYDAHEMALRRQRTKARFINTAMKVSLLGAASSDTLENGSVVSGVGGQYNFVAMAHELSDAHSILMLRSTRREGKKLTSNILSACSNETIPRHLRDIVVTEYGVAHLRGRSDTEVVQALIAIADAEFQDELIVQGQKMRKLPRHFKLQPRARANTPAHIERFKSEYAEHFQSYPFGSDFSDVELKILGALKMLKNSGTIKIAQKALHGVFVSNQHFKDELMHMSLLPTRSLREKLWQLALKGALVKNQISPNSGA